MSRCVTLELIRKRTEQYQGLLSELAEIDLHQDSLTELGRTLGRTSPNLRRIYLHNNVLSSISANDWARLTNLRFVCLALNNLGRLEHLDRCLLIEHLDVSFNLITVDTLEASIRHLCVLKHLTELHLLGNPCERQWSNCRSYVIATLPQLQRLDGKEISPGERDSAERNTQILREELENKKLKEASTGSRIDDVRATREQMSQEWVLLQQRIDQDRKRSLLGGDNQPQIFRAHKAVVLEVRELERNGEKRNVNEGDWIYTLEYETKRIVLTISIPKEIPTEDVDLEVKADFVSIVIQGQLLRLRLQHEIEDEQASAQRSQASGKLQLDLPLRHEVVLKDGESESVKTKVPKAKTSMAEEMQKLALGSEPADLDDDEPPPLR